MEPRCQNCRYPCYDAATAAVVKDSLLYCSSDCMWSCELRANPAPTTQPPSPSREPRAPSNAPPNALPPPPLQYQQQHALPPPGWTVDACGAAYPSWEAVVAAAESRRRRRHAPPAASSESGDSEGAVFEMDEELAAEDRRHRRRASTNLRTPVDIGPEFYPSYAPQGQGQ
jgi:type IV secretory pathway VirB10-like protein